MNQSCVDWTKRTLAKAGLLNSRCKVELGGAEAAVDLLAAKKESVDILFIDHDKGKYLPDLTLFEDSGLLCGGTKVIADNVLSFGRPLTAYLDHVRCSGRYSASVCFQDNVEYSKDGEVMTDIDGRLVSDMTDGVEVSTFCCAI